MSIAYYAELSLKSKSTYNSKGEVSEFIYFVRENLETSDVTMSWVMSVVEAKSHTLKANWTAIYGEQAHEVEPAQFSKTDLIVTPYDVPITKIIVENSVKDIAEQEDNLFIKWMSYEFSAAKNIKIPDD